MSKIKPLVEALTGIMGLLSFAEQDGRGLAGDNQTELETVWLPKAEAALAAAGYPIDDGPGREYVEAFNAHVRAQDARKAFPFTTHGEGKPATTLEMMRIHSLIERWLDRANGETVVCEYQVGDNNLEKYFQSWRSASHYFWKLLPRPCQFTDNVWCYLDVFTVDDKGDHLRNLGNVCLLSLYEGDIGLYCKDQRGITQPPQP